MKIGIPTLTTFKSIEEQVIFAHHLGLNLLEINLNYPYCLPSQNNPEKLKQLSQKYNIQYTIHFDEYADFASFHTSIKDAWVKQFKDTVDYATSIGAYRMTIHLFEGIHVTMPHNIIYVNEVYYKEYFDRLYESLKEMNEYAFNHHIDLCIENVSMPTFMQKTFQKLIDLGFHFTYDVGHHYEFGECTHQIYEQHFSSVKHMHLHDVIECSPHKALGTGRIDLHNMMSLAKKYDMDIIIEVKDQKDIIQSVKHLKEKDLLNIIL